MAINGLTSSARISGQAQDSQTSCPSTLYVEEVKRRCEVVEVKLKASDEVGTELCAFTFYTTLAKYEHADKVGRKPVLFLHIPVCPTEEDLGRGKDFTIRIIKSMVGIWLERNDIN
jgi:pyrrolidone-carboxylate peptidase